MWPISVGIKSSLEIAITKPGIFVFNDVFQPGGLDIAIAQGNALGGVRRNIAACRAAIGTYATINYIKRAYGSHTGCNISSDPTQGVALGYCNVKPSGLEYIVKYKDANTITA